VVLAAFARVLKVNGQAWLSFQVEKSPLSTLHGPERHPTAHQNIQGLTRDEIDEKLAAAQFVIEGEEYCEEAFCTPSPDQDGSLLPVPYLFVMVRK